MIDAKEKETDGEKEWVTRKTNQRGVNSVGASEPINAMPEPIARNFPINQRVAIHDGVIMDKPESQQQTGHKGEQNVLRGMTQ